MMLTRHIARAAPARQVASFSQSHRLASKRAPALADIEPERAETFNSRQTEFRHRLKTEREEAKRKEQAESRSKSAATDNGRPVSTSPSSVLSSTLGSLSSSFAEEARAREDAAAGKKAGPLTTLIYGTQEGREMDRDMERSFSQVLARGKYVHSIVFHQVKPDKVDDYVKLVGSWYPKVASMPEMKVNLVGSWRTEVGDCDTFGKSSATRCKAVNSPDATTAGLVHSLVQS